MDHIFVTKSFSDLSENERAQVKDLVNPEGIFPIWLKDTQGNSRRYASLAKVEENIIAWAAVDINKDGINGVGAYTREEHRSRGIAKSCINQVLSHASLKSRKGTTYYLMYDQEFKSLFKPIIEKQGFFPSSATLVYHG